ncbi:STAS domain-containing protein [Streptomyces tateyamensis]|nr:STAS domain-containing protein [Streptomyces tateyamensis]
MSAEGPEVEPQEAARLSVAVRRSGDARVVAVTGELDHDTVALLAEALAEPMDGLARVVIDLSGTGFCDSSGLNQLLRTRLDLQPRVELVVAGLRPAVARLFAITGADEVLTVTKDVEAAVREPHSPGRTPG